MLTDWEILECVKDGRISISNFDKNYVNPNSLDVCLSDEFIHFSVLNYDRDDGYISAIDPESEVSMSRGLRKTITDYYKIRPGEFLLGSTIEYIKLPNDIVGILYGKSSLGRIGLIIHATAGLIDSGFHGNITLELFNLSDRPIILRKWMRIAQLVFEVTSGSESSYAERPSSKYQGQTGPTPSMYWKNYIGMN